MKKVLASSCVLCVALVCVRTLTASVLLPLPDESVDRTGELQAEIDRVSAAGGGEVRLAKGVHTAGGVFLKDGVTLRLDEGAVLQAVTNLTHYPHTPGWDRGAVVMADGAKDVAVVGKGTIDGRGDRMPLLRKLPGRWRGVALNRCRNVRIEGVKIVNPLTWTCYLKDCDGVVVRDVTIRSHANLNNDGLDIESSNVLVEDCDIDSEDDALVFKTMTHESVVTNVTVRNCRLSSNSSFIKVGTETRGVFRDIRVSDCMIGVRTPLAKRSGYAGVPGGGTNVIGLDGISVSICDGGSLDGFTAERITMGEGIGVPVFVRISQSERVPDTVPGGSFLRNVTLRDITMEKPAVFRVPSSVTGVAAYDPWWRFWKRPIASLRPQNVLLENVTLRTAADDMRDVFADEVAEMAESYPCGKMFANDGLAPANALYVRHADGVVLRNVTFLREPGPLLRETVVWADAQVSDRAGRAVPMLEPAQLVDVRSSSDASLQKCWFYAPPEAQSQAVPLVVGLHTWSGDHTHVKAYRPVLDEAVKRGWAFVGPNFRGPNATPQGCGSDLAVADIVDAVAFAKSRVKVDASRVYITGGSGGGHMTLLMLGRHPEIFAAGAAFCPITDLARWHGESLEAHRGRSKNYAKMMERACGGAPSVASGEYAHRSPLTWLSQTKASGVPTYVATGIHDGWQGSVPVGHAIRAYNALAKPADAVSEEDIACIERTQTVPESLKGSAADDPFYPTARRIHLRRTSGNVRLTLFEGGHAMNYPAGFDFLARQRKGKPVDWTVPATASAALLDLEK